MRQDNSLLFVVRKNATLRRGKKVYKDRIAQAGRKSNKEIKELGTQSLEQYKNDARFPAHVATVLDSLHGQKGAIKRVVHL